LPRVHTFSEGTHCIDHCGGSFGYGLVRNMRPTASVVFLGCSMSDAVRRKPCVAFRRMSGSAASEWGDAFRPPKTSIWSDASNVFCG